MGLVWRLRVEDVLQKFQVIYMNKVKGLVNNYSNLCR